MPYKSLPLLTMLLCFACEWAQAQEARPITVQELTGRSQKIVIGTVLNQYSAWDDLGRDIYTYTTLRVEQIIKSERADSMLIIRQLGGRVGDVTSHVPGCPGFEVGERVMVFLGPFLSTNYYGLIDWVEGKYFIARDKRAEEVLRGMGAGHNKPVHEFVATVRRYL